jgi:hypothetical protein
MADKVASHRQDVTCRADNTKPSVQHAPMRIACPHCQAVYEVASAEPDVSFLCSRCHNEFRIGEGMEGSYRGDRKESWAPDVQLGLFEAARSGKAQDEPHYQPVASPRPPLFLERLASAEAPAVEQPEGKDAPPRSQSPRPPARPKKAAAAPVAAAPQGDEAFEPERRTPRLLTWMSGIMLLIAIAGFAYNHQAWGENIWLRSMLLNLHFPLRVHATDWRIPPSSVHAEWLKRDDGSAVLVIEGRVDNLLHTRLATPWIEVTVYDAFHSDKTVKRKTFPITLPPAIDAIRHAPWVPPPQDNVPVAAAGNRGFILVMDDLPQHAGEFTLDVVPSLFR